ncbi:MAG: hypothetical protein HDS67_00080 [Bacteroidales bacterium]|nr:hypothetical protein [Bacteroidales bacterium]
MKKWKMRFQNGIPCEWEGQPFDEEREVEPFEADLYICDTDTIGSDAVICLRPYADREKPWWLYGPNISFHYKVLVEDMVDIIANMDKGRVKGKFIFTKRRFNYGIKLYKE